jgi:hypothetical protein
VVYTESHRHSQHNLTGRFQDFFFGRTNKISNDVEQLEFEFENSSTWLDPTSRGVDSQADAYATSRPREAYHSWWGRRYPQTEPKEFFGWIQRMTKALATVNIARWVIQTSGVSWLVPNQTEFW